MKLRNKKTGEEVEPRKIGFEIYSFNERNYNSLAELNEEWEDYQEPKEFYFIDQFMSVSKGVVDDVEYAGRHKAVNYAKKTSNNLKTAGNYFETKEQAEKAVEKLKAWKRLKDKGFKFTSVYCGSKMIDFDIEDLTDETFDDLDLLFGGEE